MLETPPTNRIPRFHGLLLFAVFLLAASPASAEQLIVYVNKMDQLTSFNAISYYKTHQAVIESSFVNSDDSPACERFLFEMAMRSKSMADNNSYQAPTREVYRTQAADFLIRYIEWFKGLSDAQLQTLPANRTSSPLPEVKSGRIHTVTEFLTSILVSGNEWQKVNDFIVELPTVLYLNETSFKNWKKAVKQIHGVQDENNVVFGTYWTKFRDWATQFPLRASHRENYLSNANQALGRMGLTS